MSVSLFEPITIKNLTIKNRIVMSPMCMYSSYQENGMVEDWHLVHYTSRAVGQVGCIIVEATAVSEQGRISSHDLGIWNDQHIAGLKKLVQMMKAHGAATGIQLAHAGRKAEIDGDIVAPSPIPFADNKKTPKELKKAEIKAIVEAFKNGALRAKAAGFDCIEIHAAHGYLINEFLSPLTNKRTDEYGGSAQNRYRFLQEIIAAVSTVWKGPLFVRISAKDYHPEGMDIDDYIEMSRWMKEQGVDVIDVSSGAVVPAKIPVFPGYQVPLAADIKKGAAIRTGAVGLITTGRQAEEILHNKQADFIFIGRELLRNPYWPLTAAHELQVQLEAPVQYVRGWQVT